VDENLMGMAGFF